MTTELFRELDELAASASADSGTILFRMGGPVVAVYTVRRGRIALTGGRADRVQTIHTIGSGGILGLPGLLNGCHSVTAEASPFCELGMLHAQAVIEWLERDTQFSLLVAKAIAHDTEVLRAKVVNHKYQLRGNRGGNVALDVRSRVGA